MPNYQPSEMQQLHIIKASAGSGKTHRLTGEYLNLLFSKPNNHRHILAVTFTNKATDEMKSRIVEELHRLASGEDSDYLQGLMASFSANEEEVRSRSKRILELILHDYSSFSISTIDRFFQQTMRAFTREMGLAGGYNIEIDHSSLLMESVDLMLSELDKAENRTLADWLLRFMQDSIEDGKSWRVETQVLGLAAQLFNETYKFFTDDEQATIQDKEQLENYKQMLLRIVKSYESKAKSIGVKALNIMQQHGLAYDDFKYKRNSGFGLFLKLANGEMLKPSNRLLALLDNIDLWYSDKTKEGAIISAYHDGLNECVREIINLCDNGLHYNTAKELLKNFYTLGILNDIKNRLQRLQQENNTLLLSDTTELLNKIISDSDSPFVYEKTGTRITNYMIDEFQDTSRMQWNNFKPLIAESLSSGNFNLIVGDAKQSIYRFRNSDWRLLEEQVERDFNPEFIAKHTLDTNWRSDDNIVKFNNAFFRQASTILQDSFDVAAETDGIPGSRSESDQEGSIVNAYTDVYQQLPAKKMNSEGQVKITFLKKKEDTDWNSEVLEHLPLEIEALQDQGFALKDIAIVTRWNREAIQVAERLIAYKEEHPHSPYRYDIISNEALLIGNARSVKAIIALMRYFRNPNDSTSRMMAIYEFYRFQRKYSPGEALQAYSGSGESPRDFPAEVKQKLADLSSLPFYDMIEGFFALSPTALEEKENAYIQAFLDIVMQFSRDNSADLNAFLEWWDEEGIKKTLFSPEEQDAIRLITIHKSKGLGFGAVIMPFVNWKVDHGHNPNHMNIIWCKPKEAPFNELGVAPVKYSKKLADTIFKEDYLNEKKLTYIDNLNLLYVAFTRAKQRLIVFTPHPTNNDAITSVSDLLWQSISNYNQRINEPNRNYILLDNYLSELEEEWLFELGAPKQLDINIDKQEKERPGVSTYHTGQWLSIPFNDRLKLRLNSIGFFSDDGSRDYGKLMHEIVSNVNTLADIQSAVEQRISEGELKEEERNSTIRELNDYLSLPEVSRWYSGNYTVLNEAQVLHPQSGLSRPDRVMISPGEIIVVDYKFGETEDTRYTRQVKRYVDAIKEMGHSNVRGFVFYVKAGKIVNTG